MDCVTILDIINNKGLSCSILDDFTDYPTKILDMYFNNKNHRQIIYSIPVDQKERIIYCEKLFNNTNYFYDYDYSESKFTLDEKDINKRNIYFELLEKRVQDILNLDIFYSRIKLTKKCGLYVRAISIVKKLNLDEHRIEYYNNFPVCNLYAAGFKCNNCETHVNYHFCKKCSSPILWNNNYNKDYLLDEKQKDDIKNLCLKCKRNNVIHNDLYFLNNYCRKLYINQLGKYQLRIYNVFYEENRRENIRDIIYINTRIGKEVTSIIIDYYS